MSSVENLNFYWMENLSKDAQIAIKSEIYLTAVEAGSEIFHQGGAHSESAYALCGLKSGAINFEIASTDQGAFTIHIFRPGLWFGASQNISLSDNWQTFRARTDCELYSLSKSSFSRLEDAHPKIWRGVSAIMAANMKIMTDRIDALMMRNSTDRMLAIIRQIAGQNTNTKSANEYYVPMTQDELATAANLSSRAAWTILRDLEKKGIVRRDYGGLVLVEPQNATSG